MGGIACSTFDFGPKPGHNYAGVAIAEIVFTFVLCVVVLTTACSKSGNSEMFGLAIGSCVTVGGFAIGGISGGSLNPAVSWGIVTSHLFAKNGAVNALAYTGFGVLGAGLAAGLYKFTHASTMKDEKSEV